MDSKLVSQPAPFSKQRLRAKQVGGLPDFQAPNLYAAQMGEGVKWLSLAPDAEHPMGVICGLNVSQSGWICYAPAVVPRMKIDRFLVAVELTSFDGKGLAALQLLYMDQKHAFHKLSSTPQLANGERFRFTIPVEHLDREASFRCSLQVQLMNPAVAVVVTGAWLEAEGL